MRFSTGASLLAWILVAGSAQAQGVPATNPPPPPSRGQAVTVLYSIDANNDAGVDIAPFNTCFASESAFADYTYLTFAPKNASINFYNNPDCTDFAFGLVGYYVTHPGQAKSFRWVGWTEDTIGYFFDKNPIPGQGDAVNGGYEPSPQTPPPSGGKNPDTPPPAPGNTNDNKDQNNSGGNDNSNDISISSTFFGGVFGTLAVLSIGGIIYWRRVGKSMVEDKGKGVLPYGRMDDDDANGAEDILLTSNGKRDNFELGDDGDDEDEDEDAGREGKANEPRTARRDRYRDDDDQV
ncbi:hypothetical protein BGZ72_002789 [Mortierella alpina]|nr:hypothetical protein BGZ72_002789 [Mortierella alpina]